MSPKVASGVLEDVGSSCHRHFQSSSNTGLTWFDHLGPRMAYDLPMSACQAHSPCG